MVVLVVGRDMGTFYILISMALSNNLVPSESLAITKEMVWPEANHVTANDQQ